MADITINSIPTVAAATSASTVASAAAATSSVAGATLIGESNSDSHTSYWSAHKGWFAMVIVLVIAFVLISVAGVLLHRRYQRKQDKITTGFNSGITQRSLPMAESGGPLAYHYDGANDSSHSMPGRSLRGSSAMYLPRAGERDVHGRSNADVARELNESVGNISVGTMDNGRGTMKKDKARMRVDEVDEIA